MKKLFLFCLLLLSLSLLGAQSLTITELKENLEVSLSLSQKLNKQLNFLETELDSKNLLLKNLELDNQTLNSQLTTLKEQSQNQTVLLENLQEKNQQLMEQSGLLEEQLSNSKTLSESLSAELKQVKTNNFRSVVFWSLASFVCGGIIGYLCIR